MPEAAPCPKCKSAYFFSRNGQPVCGYCHEKPPDKPWGMVIGTPGNYSWSTHEAEQEFLRKEREALEGLSTAGTL